MIQAWFSLLPKISSVACMAVIQATNSVCPQNYIYLHSFPLKAIRIPRTGRDSLRRYLTCWLSDQLLQLKFPMAMFKWSNWITPVCFKITGCYCSMSCLYPNEDQILRMPYNYKAQNMKPLNSWPGEKSKVLPSCCQKSPYPLLKYNYNVNFSINWQRIMLKEKQSICPALNFISFQLYK